jgi:hypothetical protein
VLKQILFLVCICAAALGGAILPKTALVAGPANPEAAGEAHGEGAVYNYGETELMSAPVVMESQVAGYVLGRLVYATKETIEAEPGKLNPATMLADTFTMMFSKGLPGSVDGEWAPDVNQIASLVKELANKTAGQHVFANIYVTQLDYLTKGEVRSNSAVRREALRSD